MRDCLLVSALTLAALLLTGARPALAQADDARGLPLAELTPEQALTIDALVATVNGEPIFVKDILRPIDAKLQNMARQARSMREFKEDVRVAMESQLRTVVGEILVYSAAKDAMDENDQKKVDAFMNKYEHDMLAKYRGSRAAADQALKSKGSTLARDLAERRRKLMVEIYMHKQLHPKIQVIRRDVVNEYEKSIKKFTQEAQIDLYTITIPIRQYLKERNSMGKEVTIAEPTVEQLRAAEGQAMATARKLHDELRQIDGFEKRVGALDKLAATYSKDPKRDSGGRWQNLKRGTLAREDIEARAFTLAPFTLAEPYISADKDPAMAWVVVMMVGEVTQARVLPFGDVQKEIDQRLREKQYMDLSNAYYQKLYAQAAIDRRERVEDMIATAVDVVVARYGVK